MSCHFIVFITARGITLVESTNKHNGIQSRILVNKVIAHCKQKATQEGKQTLAFRFASFIVINSELILNINLG